MKQVITACDICEQPYDPAKEAEEPMHRMGLADPPLMTPREEARLDAELKVITAEAKKPDTTPHAKAYYEERAAVMTQEAEKRRLIAVEDRVEIDLVCHRCFLVLRQAAQQMKQKKA